MGGDSILYLIPCNSLELLPRTIGLLLPLTAKRCREAAGIAVSTAVGDTGGQGITVGARNITHTRILMGFYFCSHDIFDLKLQLYL